MDLRDAKLGEIETSLRQACELIRAHTSPAEIRAIVENVQAEWIPALVAAEMEAEEGGDAASLFPELKLAFIAVYYCNSLVDMGGLVDAVETELNSIFGAAEGKFPIADARRRAARSIPASTDIADLLTAAAAAAFPAEQKALLINILRATAAGDTRIDIEALAEMWGVAPWSEASFRANQAGAEVVPIETYRAEEGQAAAELGGGGSASGALEGAADQGGTE